MKLYSFGGSLLFSLGIHAALLTSGGSTSSNSPSLFLEIGEMSVEIVERGSTAPSPSMAPTQEAKPEPEPPKEEQTKAPESVPAFELPIESIREWLSSARARVEELAKRNEEREKAKTKAESKTEEEQAVNAPASAPSAARVGIRQEKKGVRAEAKLKTGSRPTYPADAVNRGLEGRIVIEVSIDRTGKVIETKVKQSSGHRVLDEAALSFARTMALEPATVDGVPIESTIVVPISFRLK